MKSYLVEVRVKNNYLMSAMQRRGYRTPYELCKQHNLNYSTLIGFLNLKEIPYNKRGELRPIVISLCEILKAIPEELFPAEHMYVPLRKNSAKFEASSADILAIVGNGIEPQLSIEAQEDLGWANEKLMEALETLDERTRDILRKRFGIGCEHKTLVEVAEEYNLTRERIRQIEMKGIRMLRGKLRQLRHGEDESNMKDILRKGQLYV